MSTFDRGLVIGIGLGLAAAPLLALLGSAALDWLANRLLWSERPPVLKVVPKGAGSVERVRAKGVL